MSNEITALDKLNVMLNWILTLRLWDGLTELLRTGARQMLATATEAEVDDWITSRADLRDDRGHRLVVPT